MADRRTAERLIVDPESLTRITPPEGFRLFGSAEDTAEEPTQPMRLSFLALLAERATSVQRQINERWTLALAEEPDASDEDRPTDPYVPVAAGK